MSSCHLRLRLRHVGGAHREATVIARTGEAPPDDEFRDPTYCRFVCRLAVVRFDNDIANASTSGMLT